MSVSGKHELDRLWCPSRFNYLTEEPDGSTLAFNSFQGALARVPASEKAKVDDSLSAGFTGVPTGILAELCLNGFLVPSTADELRLADALHQEQFRSDNVLELILMPNENCNFRCKYCYESFARGKMTRDVIEGVIRYVESRVSDLDLLRIGWFGGEPLTAVDIIEEISSRLQSICSACDTGYASSMTTNGSLLSPAVASKLFQAEVRRFQLTLDGCEKDHDQLRVLADGKTGTYHKILDNIKKMQESDELFRMVVRVNFSPLSLPRIGRLIDNLATLLVEDGRFFLDFRPVGHWGGPHDAQISVCNVEEGAEHTLRFHMKAVERGFDLIALRSRMKPFGTVCYAANPHSYVIGANGNVYKCTVAFDDPVNVVGTLTPDGELLLDQEKYRLWVRNGEENDPECRSCSFRPACQGNSCPLERLRHNVRSCPSIKTDLGKTLQVLAAEMIDGKRFSESNATIPFFSS